MKHRDLVIRIMTKLAKEKGTSVPKPKKVFKPKKVTKSKEVFSGVTDGTTPGTLNEG